MKLGSGKRNQRSGAEADDMTASRLARRIGLCLPLAALGVLVFASASYGRAAVGTFSFQEPITGIETDFVCQPAPTGVVSGTATTVGHFTFTDQGVHFSGTTTQNYRIDFADGRYLVSSSPTHFEFNAQLLGRSQAVNTEVQQDRGTLYTAAGQTLGIVSVFGVTHTTWTDSNGNGQPDPGEITADVNIFRVMCP